MTGSSENSRKGEFDGGAGPLPLPATHSVPLMGGREGERAGTAKCVPTHFQTAPEPPVHASCVAVRGRGVLIAGPSGAGKSDLALRLIDRGAALVSDDYTLLTATDGVLHAAPPATIAGRIEVRGIGIVERPFVTDVPVVLWVEAGVPDRMPEPATRTFAGIALPCFTLALLDASAPARIDLLLDRIPH